MTKQQREAVLRDLHITMFDTIQATNLWQHENTVLTAAGSSGDVNELSAREKVQPTNIAEYVARQVAYNTVEHESSGALFVSTRSISEKIWHFEHWSKTTTAYTLAAALDKNRAFGTQITFDSEIVIPGIHDDVIAALLFVDRSSTQDITDLNIHGGLERLNVTVSIVLAWLRMEGIVYDMLQELSTTWGKVLQQRPITDTVKIRALRLHMIQAYRGLLHHDGGSGMEYQADMPIAWIQPLWQQAVANVVESVDHLHHTIDMVEAVVSKYEQPGVLSWLKNHGRPWWTLGVTPNRLSIQYTDSTGTERKIL